MDYRESEPLTERELEILGLIAKGFSDREISQKLYLSVNTVKWHNRQIYAKLGVGSRTEAVSVASRGGLLDQEQQPTVSTFKIKKHNLPAPVSSFVGREKEIGDVKELLASNRLVTMTGPGGVGKTRLALQTVSEIVIEKSFLDGVFFVDLAPVMRPERVGEVILESMGLTAPVGQSVSNILEKHLGDKNILLILDNFEHLLEAAPLIGYLLSVAPNLSVMNTSREALNLSGEQIYPVNPLNVPELVDEIDPSYLDEYESVNLFITRARAIHPKLEISDQELLTVAKICICLDGIPLAIELAASRMNLYTSTALLEQLEKCSIALKGGPLDFPERHQTLQKAIDWSYDLLDEEDQILFRRLSVFQGSRTIDAAEQVCCHDLSKEICDGLSSLVSKNLIMQEKGLDEKPRFFMLETIHSYARERLMESGEADTIKFRHASYFTELSDMAKYPTRGGPDQIRWLLSLKADFENLRAVFDWSLQKQGDVSLGMRLVGSLGFFWIFATSSGKEVEDWVTRALKRLDEVPPKVQAQILSIAGTLFFYGGKYEISTEMYTEALKIFKSVGDKREYAWTLALSTNSVNEDSYMIEYFRNTLQEAIDLFQELGDMAGLALALVLLGWHENSYGNTARAVIALESSYEVAKENNLGLREAVPLEILGSIAKKNGEFNSALNFFKECIRLELSLGFIPEYSAPYFVDLAGIALLLDLPIRAVVLLGSAVAHFLPWGFVEQPEDSEQYQDYLNETHAKLDQRTFMEAWEKGQSLSFEQALAFALDEENPGL